MILQKNELNSYFELNVKCTKLCYSVKINSSFLYKTIESNIHGLYIFEFYYNSLDIKNYFLFVDIVVDSKVYRDEMWGK